MQPRTSRPLPVGMSEALNARKVEGTYRTLVELDLGYGAPPSREGGRSGGQGGAVTPSGTQLIDLCSNDYLGIARRTDFFHGFEEWRAAQATPLGATGSRLVSGNNKQVAELEEFLATFHGAEEALLFNSGYEANSALLGCIARRSDTILYDEYVHASSREGILLSASRSHSFRHNDVADLRAKIARSTGTVFVAIESLYSMDGDEAPLTEIVATCEEFGAHLIVDEAHSGGVYGERGEGLLQSMGLQEKAFARVHTFGKAIGFRGACVLGTPDLKSYLVNFARSFIYSTGPDLFTVWAIRQAYECMMSCERERGTLHTLARHFRDLLNRYPAITALPSPSAIQGIVVPGNRAVAELADHLCGEGFFVRAIRSPTVPKGKERVRVCLHSFNSLDEITDLLTAVDSFLARDRLDSRTTALGEV